MKKKVL